MYHGFQNNWFCGPGGFFNGIHGGFFHLVVWGLVLIALFMLIRSVFFRNKTYGVERGATPQALRILEERYAAGEIEREDFLNKKKDLGY